jgi:hypothetical protein
MEKKQTAVEWLEEQDNVLTMKLLEKKLTPREFVVQKSKLVDKAKQMEKEQIEYFFNCGRQYQLTGEGTFKQVHNETYGGQDD